MSQRYRSLDVFRGITIASMILVNTPGSWAYIYAPLQHAEWHGYTPTDLVFPFFLIAVGLSMAFSFKNMEGLNAPAFHLKIFRRSIIIFLIGFALTAFPFFGKDYSQIRILGVLQRIAIVYLLASLMIYWLKKPIIIIALSFLILIGYWQLLLWLGGDNPYSLEGNLARKLDLLLLGENHMWHGMGIAFDPEGLLSSLTATISVISGFLLGLMIQSMDKTKLLTRLAGLSVVLLLIGYLWSIMLPINKALWTSSYVFVTTGIAGLFLCLIIYIVDFKSYTRWAVPFEIFGRNPLISFIASILWVKTYFLIRIDGTSAYGWLYNEVFKGIVNPTFGSLLFALVHVLGCWLIAYILYRKRIIIKI